MSTRRVTAPATLLVLAAVALAPARQDRPGPPAPEPVPVVVSADVAGLWDHKALVPVREARGRLEFAWMVQSLVGLAPNEIDRLTLVLPGPDADPVLVVTGRKPIDPAAVARTLTRRSGAKGRRPCRGCASPPGPSSPTSCRWTAGPCCSPRRRPGRPT